jgi:hypothetical protein
MGALFDGAAQVVPSSEIHDEHLVVGCALLYEDRTIANKKSNNFFIGFCFG